MMRTYGPTTPNAMCQNMMTFLSPYNPQDSPELLFKHSAECQEVAIIANVKYTNKQHLMNVIYLLTRCGIYQRNLEDWERQPKADKNVAQLAPVYPGNISTPPCLRYHDIRTGWVRVP